MTSLWLLVAMSATFSHQTGGGGEAGIDRWHGEERQALETLGNLAAVDARLRFKQWNPEHGQAVRKDAVQRSVPRTPRGKVTEHIIPNLQACSYLAGVISRCVGPAEVLPIGPSNE
jgi:hypothetical protein